MKKITLLICFVLFLSLSYKATAQTAGTLTFTVTEATHSSTYSGSKNVLAIWIESCAACTTSSTLNATYVRTKMRYWGAQTTDHLPRWTAKAASSTTNATTGSTLTSFTSKTITWDGKNAAQTAAMPDGSYRVAVEECWAHGTGGNAVRYFPFTKGPASDLQSPTADTNFTNITLNWVPDPLANDTFNLNPDASVYPNPSTGIINLDFNNEVSNIKVIDLTGKTVYTEDVDAQSAAHSTKEINLSQFANGYYNIQLSNDKGSSTYKVMLEK